MKDQLVMKDSISLLKVNVPYVRNIQNLIETIINVSCHLVVRTFKSKLMELAHYVVHIQHLQRIKGIVKCQNVRQEIKSHLKQRVPNVSPIQ